MSGWGYSSRDIAAKTDVSHMTIENWLADKHQAGPEQVDKVARLFGWTYGQLYSGEAPAGIMDRVAELDAFRAKARRLGLALISGSGLSVEVEEMDPALFTSLPKQS